MYYTDRNKVLNFRGEDYQFGDKLPEDLPASTIEALLAKRKVSETKPTAETDTEGPQDGFLRDRVRELTLENDSLREDLQDAMTVGNRLNGMLDTAQAEITRLTGLLETARGEAQVEVARLNGLLDTAQEEVTRLKADNDALMKTIAESAAPAADPKAPKK